MLLLSNKQGDAVVEQLSDEVNDPESCVDARDKSQNTDDEVLHIAVFHKAKNTVDAADFAPIACAECPSYELVKESTT